MRNKITSLCVAVACSFGATAASAEVVKFGLCYDLTKSYTFATPWFAQAAQDLATLVNSEGGINGNEVEIIVRDTANEPQRGIECYEKLKHEGVFIFDTMSTPVSHAVLPRAMRDKNVMMQSLVGRGDAIVGDVFDWIFPVGPTYWNQAANNMEYIKQQSGGSLEDAKIAFVFMDHPFGYEPQPVLKKIAETENAEIRYFPFPLPGVDQSSVWSQVRRYDPDWVMVWAISNMHVVSAREMRRNGIPMDKYIGANWLSEVDVENMGDIAVGIKRGSVVSSDLDNPLRQEIVEKVYGAGNGAASLSGTERTYYFVGLSLFSTAFEAVRLATEQGDTPLTADMVRAGYEKIENFENHQLTSPVTITAEDHGGNTKTQIESWDGEKWVPETEWFSAYEDIVRSVARESAQQYLESNSDD